MSEEFRQIIKQKTDADLCEIYLNKSSYQPEFYKLASQEIYMRSIDLNALNEQLAEKEKAQSGPFLPVDGNPLFMIRHLVGAAIIGPFGIAKGYKYVYSTTIAADGQTYFTYNEPTRNFGRVIMVTGIISTGIWVINFIINFSPE